LEKINVNFFGDSICSGQGVSLYCGWVARISRELDRIFEASDIQIVVTNNAINGRQTRQALENMPYEIQSHSPDLLVVQFGMNDCNYWETDRGMPRVSPEAFRANILEIISRAKVFKTKQIILNTNHPTLLDTDLFPETDTSYEQSNQTYNAIIRDIGLSLKGEVIFIDIAAGFKKVISSGEALSKYLLEDKLHLNKKGHDLYYDLVYPIVKGIVTDQLVSDTSE